MKRRSRIPIEFLLLRKIRWAFRHRQTPDGWTRVSKTEITRRFLYVRAKNDLTPEEFYFRVLPGWIARGLAREIPQPGKQPYYLLRGMTLDEINARWAEVEHEGRRLQALHADSTGPEDDKDGILAAFRHVGHESYALLIERKAVVDESLKTVSAPPVTSTAEKSAGASVHQMCSKPIL